MDQKKRRISEISEADQVIYFDQLPSRTIDQDMYTNNIDELFRESCFKNAVCTITTNLNINIVHFTNILRGQLTSILPGNRLVIPINGQRYSIICYASGKFVLTNLFFFNRLKDIYDFFINFSLLLVSHGIARLVPVDIDTGNGDEYGTTVYNRLAIKFLVENCQFSFRVKNEYFQQRYLFKWSEAVATKNSKMILEGNAMLQERPPKTALLSLLEYIKSYLEDKLHIVIDYKCKELGSQDKSQAFPADLIRISVKRKYGEFLKKFKSTASSKRNKFNFQQQRMSLLIFNNGKVIITGMQTREDLVPIFDLMYAISNFFLV